MNRNSRFHILVVDDEVEYQTVFAMILGEQGYDVATCSNGQEALRIISQREINLILTDLKMPGISGLDLVKRVKEYDSEIELLVVTAFGSIESAVQAMKYGASGYFVKSSDPPESLLADVERMARIHQLQASNEILKQQSPIADIFLNTQSPKFAQVLDMCRKAASSNINVLLQGESGVGKEVIANFIHKQSDRCDQHFIAVNCQVFSDGTLESELFGHEKGAFTGAAGRRIGRFEEANFGTLFLDEIGDLPLPTQGKLLRSLEQRSIERMGSNRSINLDIRLISATNKLLSEKIHAREFREDLLYRINALTITIPPLRERKEDLPWLIQFFLKRIESDQKKRILEIDASTMGSLLSYDYPGNIRELKNILERMVTLSDNNRLAAPETLFSLSSKAPLMDLPLEEQPLRQVRAAFEAEYLQQVLNNHRGNAAEAAAVLGITRRQLWNKISEYHLTLPPRK